MRSAALNVSVSVTLGFVLAAAPARADEADDLLAQAQKLVTQGKYEEALGVAGKAIRADPVKGYFFRAALYDVLQKPREALADYDRLIQKEPSIAEAYDLRGWLRFKRGDFKGAVADFDKVGELKPKEKDRQWKRGIALYYAGRYEDARKQFKAYEAADPNDLESALWYFLSVARSAGLKDARRTLPRAGRDERVPLRRVYDLFAGDARPDDVLAAARKVPRDARPELRRQQLFYANFYLGLYGEVRGDRKQAVAYLTRAVRDYGVVPFMGDVARVDLARLEKEAKGK